MKRAKKFLGFTFVIVMIFALSACGESAQSGPATNARDAQAQSQGNGIEPLDLILSHHTSENDSNHVYALAFADAVKELSGGKMKVEVYANGQLFGQADALAALSQGTLDIALSDTALFANYNPAGAIFDMPYLIESREQAIRMVKDKEIIDIIRGIMLNSSHLHVLELLSNLVYGSSGGAPVRLVRYTNSVLENYSCDDFSKKLIAFELSPPLLC